MLPPALDSVKTDENAAVAMPDRLLLATRNAGKRREILAICADWPVKWLGPEERTWPEVEEAGETYLENAALKARAAAAAAGLPALAEDSGIEVAGLGSRPGPRSARFAGESASDADNLRLLIEELRGVAEDRRSAAYRCVAVVAWPDGGQLWAEGTCTGRVVLEPRGAGGFGYDPIFVPDGELRTMAELSLEEKDAVSHRGRALRALAEKLLER
jgi:XTP/dITP diphosphohydrolase